MGQVIEKANQSNWSVIQMFGECSVFAVLLSKLLMVMLRNNFRNNTAKTLHSPNI